MTGSITARQDLVDCATATVPTPDPPTAGSPDCATATVETPAAPSPGGPVCTTVTVPTPQPGADPGDDTLRKLAIGGGVVVLVAGAASQLGD